MFSFDNSWARELDGTFVPWEPERPPAPELVFLNDDLATTLGLPLDALRSEAAELLSGARLPEGAEPLAQAYAGHQFGNLSPQLGDGRAVLLGELLDPSGARHDLHLKGSGRTPFARGGDGRATLGPMLREVLLGEAMHALDIPTTRALAVVATGRSVMRHGPEPGAVLARVAASHLRVGTLEFFAIRDDAEHLRQLVDYALRRHGPAPGVVPALTLLEAVRDRQARLVARWMGVGFIHGVMNTDNVTLSGQTIDYGPCAFLERHDPAAVFSSIDHGGRYAYGNQPRIMGWNLARLAAALLPVIDADTDRAIAAAQAVLDGYSDVYEAAWDAELRRKLGLASQQDDDRKLLDDLLGLLRSLQPDHTRFFRALGHAARGDDAPVLAEVDDALLVRAWLTRWRDRLALDGPLAARADAMDRVNPWVVARNHRVEEALAAAVAGDMAPFQRLLEALRAPFTPRSELEDLTEPAPPGFTEGYQTFCGT